MKKLFKITIPIITILFLMTGSFFLGNRTAITMGHKIVIDKDSFNTFSNLEKLQDIIEEYYLYDIDYDNIETTTYKGFLKGLGDPYTEYLTKEEYEKMKEVSDGEYYGIGIYITVTEDNLIKVVSPIKNSPAYKAGIKTDDIISKINDVSFLGDQLNEAMAIMKGKPGTNIKLGIKRTNSEGSQEDIDLELTVAKVELKTVEYSNIGNIGYISISQFAEKTYDEFVKAFDSLKEDNVKGIILDLRNNPGGLKDSSVDIADYLLPEGPIVKTINKRGDENISYSDPKEQDLPMVVIVNNGSASASEILSGAIKDYNKATIIGNTTFGKGLVQTLAPMSKFGIDDEGALKITIQEYFTPKNNKINKIGVTPDIIINLPDDIINIGPEFINDDTQLQKAVEILNS